VKRWFVTPTRDGEFRQEVMATFEHPDSGDVHLVYLDGDCRGERLVAVINFAEMLRLGYQAWVVDEEVVEL